MLVRLFLCQISVVRLTIVKNFLQYIYINSSKTGIMNDVHVVPISNRVVVKPLTRDKITMSGIYIPDTASKEKPEQGVVIAVGPGAINDKGEIIPMSVAVGDTVLFSKFSPEEIKINDEDLLIMREETILAIIKENN